jgi:hypothetical protein
MKIDGRALILCDGCGSLAHFEGGISPVLKGRLAERGIYLKSAE